MIGYRKRPAPEPHDPAVGYAYALPAVIDGGFFLGRLDLWLWQLYGPSRWLLTPERRSLLSRGVFSCLLDLEALGRGEEARRRIGEAQARLLARGGRL